MMLVLCPRLGAGLFSFLCPDASSKLCKFVFYRFLTAKANNYKITQLEKTVITKASRVVALENQAEVLRAEQKEAYEELWASRVVLQMKVEAVKEKREFEEKMKMERVNIKEAYKKSLLDARSRGKSSTPKTHTI